MKTTDIIFQSDSHADSFPSWIALDAEICKLAGDLEVKTQGTVFATESAQLAAMTKLISQELEQVHAEHIQLRSMTAGGRALSNPPDTSSRNSALEKNWECLQGQNHELRAEFRDVLKALFMWRDVPERQKF